MADGSSRQILRRCAIVAAYSLFLGFAVAALLSLDLREFDARSVNIIALMVSGAFLGGALTLFCLRRFVFKAKAVRFIITFIAVILATLICEGGLAGVQFYKTVFSLHDDFATLDGWLELFFTGAHGFAYFFVFGLHMFWPALIAAGLLFALATLSLTSAERLYH